MFNNVDLIGAEAVCKMLEQTQLKRFIIYRQGAAKGSTPVYDCSHTITNGSAIKCFKDWAINITQFNPNNYLCYELLAFNDYEEGEASPNELNSQVGKKRGKMRVTFALNAPMQQNFAYNMPAQQNNAPAINIEEEIRKGIEAALIRKELEELRRFKKEIEEEEEEEEEENDAGNIVDKVAGILNTFKEHAAEQNAAQINGNTVINEDLTIKTQNINKAIKILWKHNKNLDKDLLKLADLAENDNLVFKMVLNKLRNF
jgi:hypothetical protein